MYKDAVPRKDDVKTPHSWLILIIWEVKVSHLNKIGSSEIKYYFNTNHLLVYSLLFKDKTLNNTRKIWSFNKKQDSFSADSSNSNTKM